MLALSITFLYRLDRPALAGLFRIWRKAMAKRKNGQDKFGLRTGTKASKAAAMFAAPGGATMAAVKKRLGQTHYNLLKRLAKAGCKITRKDHVIRAELRS
jgi:hypothetical protein